MARFFYSKDAVYDYGKKHNGKTIGEIIAEDPHYLLWSNRRYGFVKFSEDIIEEATKEAALKVRRKGHYVGLDR